MLRCAPARVWVAAAAAALLVPTLGAEQADAKFPAGLVFAHKRAVDVSLEELRKGARVQLCNTGETTTRVEPVFDGFKFRRGGRDVEPEKVVAATTDPSSPMLPAGKCARVTLVAHGELDTGTYSGTFAYVGKAAGIARVRLRVVNAVSDAATAHTIAHVHETEFGGLGLDGTVRVRVPRGTPGLRDVIVAADDEELEDAVNSLMSRLGMPGVSYRSYLPTPRLVLSDTAATLTIPQPGDVYSFDSISGRQRGDLWGGDISLTRDGELMRLTLAGPDRRPDRNTTAPRIAWVAEATVPAQDQRRRSPPPEEVDGDLARWSFAAGSLPARPSITFKLPEDVERKLLLGNKVPRALQAGSFFVAEALFVLLLLLLTRVDRGEGRGRSWLRRVAWAAIALLVGMLIVWVVQTLVEGSGWRAPSDNEFWQWLFLFVQIGAPLAGAAILMHAARGGSDRRVHFAAAGLLALAAGVMLMVALRTYRDPHPGPLGWELWGFEVGRKVLAVLAVLLVFALCVLVIGAAVEIVRRSWPPGAVRDWASRISPRWRWTGVLGLSALAALQWTWAVAKRYEDSAPLEVDDEPLPWWDALGADVGWFPLGMLGRVTQLLPLVVAIAAIPLMRHYGGRSARSFGKRDRPILLLILIFGGVVAGTAGALEGFRVPIALIVSLVLLYLVLRDREPRAGEPPLDIPERKALINSAVEREDYRRKQQSLYTGLQEGEKKLGDYRRELAGLTPPPEETDPLSPGVFDELWKNIEAAVRIGVLLSIVPVAYYVGVVVVDQIGEDLSATADWGIVDLLVGLVAEVGTWLAAAFVLGGLYAHLPFRQGPAKGAVLSLVFGAGIGVAAGVLQGDSSWLFRWLEMFLFLGVLGFLIDRRTLERHGFYWRELFDVYRVREARFATGYVSTFGLALVGLLQQILSGDASQTITTLVEAAGTALPDPTA